MAESISIKRVVFSKGEQKKFLQLAKENLCVTWNDLAAISGIGVRNLADWRNEKYSMTLSAVERICEKRNIPVPTDISTRDAYWYVSKGARAGGRATVEKHGSVGGNPEYRKKKWHEWWEREGKFKPSKIIQTLPFRKPVFSEELAEFVGIMLGDGGISKHQFTVTLNSVTDKEYLKFVEKLIRKLFDVSVGAYRDKRSLAKRIVVSRIGLVSYLTNVVGMKAGNKVKQQVDIPVWVKENRSYSIACLRGLIDTDGCIILHQYLSKGKRYQYKKVGFTSRSYPLIKSASETLLILGIKHRIMKNGWDIRIEAGKDVERYFQVVGTHNSKHEKRYKMA